MTLHLKRAYDPPAASDGYRVLVDRLWPRGLTKEEARIDLWLKDVAPSTELRKWYNHDPARWTEFGERYAAELRERETAVDQLAALVRERTVTLVYAAKDTAHCHPLVLKTFLEHRKRGKSGD